MSLKDENNVITQSKNGKVSTIQTIQYWETDRCFSRSDRKLFSFLQVVICVGRLFHTLMACGKKENLKQSVLYRYS